MQQLGGEWRPDLSNVLIRLKQDATGGLILQPLANPNRDLTALPVMELVGGCIANSVPIYISVPTKPGYCHALVELNGHLAKAVEARDLRDAQRRLAEVIAAGVQATTDPA